MTEPVYPTIRRPRLADLVRERIASEYIIGPDAVTAGDLLPSEAALCQRYGVSRPTVRAALRSLQAAGLVRVRQGVGVTVLRQSSAVVQGLDRLCSLETLAREAGRTVEPSDTRFIEMLADAAIAARLRVSEGHGVLAIERVEKIDGVPAAFLLDYIPAGVVGFDEIKASVQGSVLDFLLARADVQIEYADTELMPVTLTQEIARRLSVKARTPAMYVEAVAVQANERVADAALAWILPAHFRFVIRRRSVLPKSSAEPVDLVTQVGQTAVPG